MSKKYIHDSFGQNSEFSKGLWNGESISNFSNRSLKNIYKYCVRIGEDNKAEEIMEELKVRNDVDI